MMAGTTTRSIGENRISLPRASLGALLAGTLLGAAGYAGISAATGSVAPAAAVVVAPMQDAHAAVTKARIKAGSGPLVGDAPGIAEGPTASPSERDRHAEITGHARGHGPLE